MASSKTRRKAEEHGVRDGAKRMERHDAALWWLHSELSKERFNENMGICYFMVSQPNIVKQGK